MNAEDAKLAATASAKHENAANSHAGVLETGTLGAGYFRKKFGVELLEHFAPQFERLLQQGHVEIEGDEIRLTREALLRIDWFLPMFYLPEHIGIRYT